MNSLNDDNIFLSTSANMKPRSNSAPQRYCRERARSVENRLGVQRKKSTDIRRSLGNDGSVLSLGELVAVVVMVVDGCNTR